MAPEKWDKTFLRGNFREWVVHNTFQVYAMDSTFYPDTYLKAYISVNWAFPLFVYFRLWFRGEAEEYQMKSVRLESRRWLKLVPSMLHTGMRFLISNQDDDTQSSADKIWVSRYKLLRFFQMSNFACCTSINLIYMRTSVVSQSTVVAEMTI